MKTKLGILALLALTIFSAGCCGWGWRCEPGPRRHWWHHDRY